MHLREPASVALDAELTVSRDPTGGARFGSGPEEGPLSRWHPCWPFLVGTGRPGTWSPERATRVGRHARLWALLAVLRRSALSRTHRHRDRHSIFTTKELRHGRHWS
jgi:hypothetical protein